MKYFRRPMREGAEIMERKSLAQQTTERIYNSIVAEQGLKPGEKLPNELELSAQMGVSRTTLREALQTLIARGILEVRRGKGTFVTEQVDRIDDYGFTDLSRTRGQLRDLFELRSVVEPSAAQMACARATEEEMEEILRRGEAVQRCIATGHDRTEADRAFHGAILRGTHNEFFMRLIPLIHRAVTAAILTGEREAELAAHTARDHAMLMEFFRSRDGEGAQCAMGVHLRHAAALLLDDADSQAHQ